LTLAVLVAVLLAAGREGAAQPGPGRDKVGMAAGIAPATHLVAAPGFALPDLAGRSASLARAFAVL
jgi:hypothetical protein